MSELPLHKMFVDGKPTDALSGKTFEIENPATGEPVARVPEGDKADIDNAIDIATSAFEVWGKMPGEIRSNILNKAAAILAAQINNFVRVEVSQTGRPIRELTSQLARLPEWFSYYASSLRVTLKRYTKPRGSPLWTTWTTSVVPIEGSMLDADKGSMFNAD